MRLHLLTSRGLRAHSFTFPLRVFARQLKQAGIHVRLFYRHDAPRLTACDVLGVVSDYFGIQHLITRQDDVLQFLERCRERVGALLWFDVTAGTGTLFEPAFAVVDLYAKKQLLRDRTLYKTPYYEREYHLHYFYENYGEHLAALGEKARIVNHRGLEDWEIERFKVSWNLGLGDYSTFWGRGRETNRCRPEGATVQARASGVTAASVESGGRAACPGLPPGAAGHRGSDQRERPSRLWGRLRQSRAGSVGPAGPSMWNRITEEVST